MTTIGSIKGDTRILDYGSYSLNMDLWKTAKNPDLA